VYAAYRRTGMTFMLFWVFVNNAGETALGSNAAY
jgi:hypothetical protein